MSQLQATAPRVHHTAADLHQYEKQMKKEETLDQNALKTAQKSLANSEKTLKKAEKVSNPDVFHHATWS